MPFIAELDMGGDLKEVNVIDFSYSLNRSIDQTGRPVGNLVGGTISITVFSTPEMKLLDWMINSKSQDGEIRVSDPEGGKIMRKINFEKAYVVDFSESFQWQSSDNMMVSFTISAKKLSVAGAEWDNTWERYESA